MGSPWGSRLQHARRERLTHAKYAFLLSSVSRVIRTLRAWSNWAKAARWSAITSPPALPCASAETSTSPPSVKAMREGVARPPCGFSTTRTPHRIVAANAAVCRLTGFAESELVDTRLGWLEESTTLNLFGDYYRKDVLEHPDATDHANIRAFMKVGWDGVKFPDGLAVTPKNLGDYVSYGPSIVDAYNNY